MWLKFCMNNGKMRGQLGEGRITWGAFKMTFLDSFFHLELRERKMQEFINLCQRNVSVKEYSLKFTQLSKYAPTMDSYLGPR